MGVLRNPKPAPQMAKRANPRQQISFSPPADFNNGSKTVRGNKRASERARVTAINPCPIFCNIIIELTAFVYVYTFPAANQTTGFNFDLHPTRVTIYDARDFSTPQPPHHTHVHRRTGEVSLRVLYISSGLSCVIEL